MMNLTKRLYKLYKEQYNGDIHNMGALIESFAEVNGLTIMEAYNDEAIIELWNIVEAEV